MLLFWREKQTCLLKQVSKAAAGQRLHLLKMDSEASLLPPSGAVVSGGSGRGLGLCRYLDEFKDGEGGRAVVGVDAAQDAVELRVEAAVAEAQQEAAQQGDGHAEDRRHSFRPGPSRPQRRRRGKGGATWESNMAPSGWRC